MMKVSLLMEAMLCLSRFCMVPAGAPPKSINLRFATEEQAELFRCTVQADPRLFEMMKPKTLDDREHNSFKLCGIEVVTSYEYPLRRR